MQTNTGPTQAESMTGGDIPILILAAGAGRRLRQIKPLLSWQGVTLLERALGQARRLSPQVCVVLGAYAPLVRVRTRVAATRWLVNRHWASGMASSLRLGVSKLPAEAPGVLVMLVDQPDIPLAHYVRLLDAARREPYRAWATAHAGRPGVPAYLPRPLWSALRRLQGDQGARQVLAGAGAGMLTCPQAHQDIDTSADVNQWISRQPPCP
ncbi:MAG: nucleotidyltransferase family protein [Gammaproteobacteria bacterium]|nr:nucleotidyltransferase family protein [Gammaproteobacteria bacterium]